MENVNEEVIFKETDEERKKYKTNIKRVISEWEWEARCNMEVWKGTTREEKTGR